MEGMDSKLERELLNEAQEFTQEVLDHPARRKMERLWFENIAMYEGYHWMEYNASTQEYLFYKDFNSGKIKTSVNDIKPITLKQVARLLKKKPRLTGAPINSTTDPELYLLSNQVSFLFSALEHKLKMRTKLKNVLIEAFNCGIGWMSFNWDPNGGDVIDQTVPVMDELGNISVDENGNPITEVQQVNIGDVGCTVWSPFDVIVSPSVQCFEDIRRLQTKTYQHPDEILEQYGVTVQADRRSEDESTFGKKYRYLMSKQTTSSASKMGDAVMKVVDYMLPSKKYPKGRYMVYAGQTILDYREELPFNKLMFVPVGCLSRLNQFHGDTFIRQLTQPQRQQNRILSLMLEILYSHGYPYWIVDKGSGILKKGIKGEPMQILEYNSGFRPPSQIQPPAMPNYAFQLMDKVQSSMSNIASQHEVTRGQIPPGLNNNQALLNLMEADDITISLVEQDFYDSYAMCGDCIKIIVAEMYDEDRVLLVSGEAAGEMSAGTSLTFKRDAAKRLKDIRIITEVAPDLPYSRSGKIQMVNDMVKSGFIDMNNPNDKRLARRIVDFSGIAKELSLDEKNAMRENISMSRGEQVKLPKPWEDHQVHIYTHYTFMKTPEFEAICAQNPEIEAIFMTHTMETEKMLPPPPAPEVPKKMGVNVKVDGGTPEGMAILQDAGVLPPPPPPAPPEEMPPEGQLPPEQMPMEMFPEDMPTEGLPPEEAAPLTGF